jgi:cystathionine gamma-synthase
MSSDSNDQLPSIQTLLAQGGGAIHGPYEEVVAPIHVSTTYQRAADNSFPGGAGYSRDANPTYHEAERLICALERGADALVFSSGVAAAATVFQSLKPGSRIVAPQMMYWGLRKWLIEFCENWQIQLDLFAPAKDGAADSCGTENLESLLSQPADLLWLETPANPTWDITDIAVAAGLAKAAGAFVCVDSTVATPVLSQPLGLGADIVMHSATKYLNGHTDVVMGALVTATCDERWEKIRSLRAGAGAIAGPFETWLLTRGMRTLFPRVQLACQNAQAIAQHFRGHKKLSAVLYPGLVSHPGHDIAKAQMSGGFSGMLSIRFAGGEQAAIDAAAAVSVFKRATSLGSTESLIEHRASIEGEGTYCPPDLLRLSVGIERIDDLINDLEQAINQA